MIIKIKIQKYPYNSLMAISSKQKKELINLKIHQLRLWSLRNKKSKMKKESIQPQNLWDITKCTNYESPRWRRGITWNRKICLKTPKTNKQIVKLIAKTSQMLIYTSKKFNKFQVRINSKRSTPKHIMIKLPKAKGKVRILK